MKVIENEKWKRENESKTMEILMKKQCQNVTTTTLQ